MVHGPLGMPRLACQQSGDPQLDNGLQTPFLRATLSFLKSLGLVATTTKVLRLSSDQTTLEATKAIRQKRTRQNLKACRTKSTLTKDSVQISVPNLSNSKRGSSTLGRTGKLSTSLKKLRINKRKTKGIRIAKSKLKDTDIIKLKLQPVTRIALEILTIADEKGTGKISKEIEATDTKELRAADPYLKAKELALFARSFLKELKYSRPDDNFKTQLKIFANQASRYGLTSEDYLTAFPIMLIKEAITFYYNHVIKAKLPTFKANNLRTSLSECFKKLAKELKGIQGSLRPSLKDDRSLADKLYSAYKNVPETTIARMNLAFTFTAAIADIRKAIAFAIKTSRPLAKASKAYASFSEPHDHTCFHNILKADSDLDEEYECFIQDRQYFGGKKAAKATIKGEKRRIRSVYRKLTKRAARIEQLR
ncbi:hypothetical protein MBM_06968 [Drepanopeziza brunnea f. sp. 'multigermtubi' MB_m1]|uniref:Uncharacterized protein n=1 Tax=Marssonina brunnea f. sp. multigermtubi (strain MB_m1) TaxID=1072389 RepID=K1WQX5_MARBU|nr:uncharacterized protein MBM_06968 [Drepanopeziza brunnea f. sp. 'multigermtubi' MB_m1]EKD14757.1 hypothetical protein MBM_06968 [Drepanopeziza brunnea f. sp. 'multigermtubi' MB_m1]